MQENNGSAADMPYKVISVIGPTASGKTALAISLVHALEEEGRAAEIINADAYQMYRGMDIGTAKASVQERAEVKHHLIDIISPQETMTAARFQKLARCCIADIQARGATPVLVGGSGLYARAAIDDISFPGTDPQIRSDIEQRGRDIGAEALFAELEQKDPVAASRMDWHNIRRTVRALEVIALTGKPYSAALPHYRYIIPAVQIGLDLTRENLDERINLRTRRMREAGFTNEVRQLRDRLGATAIKALGYRQIIDYCDGLIDEDEAYERIAHDTRRLARKQMGWFGRDPRIHWLDATAPDLPGLAVDIVHHADSGDYDRDDRIADTYVQHHLGGLGQQASVGKEISGI